MLNSRQSSKKGNASSEDPRDQYLTSKQGNLGVKLRLLYCTLCMIRCNDWFFFFFFYPGDTKKNKFCMFLASEKNVSYVVLTVIFGITMAKVLIVRYLSTFIANNISAVPFSVLSFYHFSAALELCISEI